MKEDLKFEAFKGLVSLSMEDLSRDLFQGNRDSIKIKKEGVAVRNLEKILNAALTLSSQKGFAACLLYTSAAADDLLCVDLGGRRIIKQKTTTKP